MIQHTLHEPAKMKAHPGFLAFSAGLEESPTHCSNRTKSGAVQQSDSERSADPTLDANFVEGFPFTSHFTGHADQQTTINLFKTDFIAEF